MRVVFALLLAAAAIAACDRVVDLSPPPDAISHDGNVGLPDAGIGDGGLGADAGLGPDA